MKKTKAIYLIVVALVIGLTGCKDEVADRNAANIKLITEGMHWREAYRIMGEWQNCDTGMHSNSRSRGVEREPGSRRRNRTAPYTPKTHTTPLAPSQNTSPAYGDGRHSVAESLSAGSRQPKAVNPHCQGSRPKSATANGGTGLYSADLQHYLCARRARGTPINTEKQAQNEAKSGQRH